MRQKKTMEFSRSFWLDRARAILDRMDQSALCSHDPYDALGSRGIRSLSRIHPFVGRAAIQAVKLSPVNFRPLVGIRKIQRDPKVLSDLVLSHLNLYEVGENTRQHLTEAVSFGDSLLHEAMRESDEMSWGLKFPYISRSTVSDRTPNLFTTTNAALAILHLYKVTRERKYRVYLEQINRFLTRHLGYVTPEEGYAYFRYFPGMDIAFYNVNSFAAGYLEEYARTTGDESLSSLSDQIIAWVLHRQNDDGSWFYSSAKDGNWVDGFHTGYLLEGLMIHRQRSRSREVLSATERAIRFYASRLFRDNFPLYYPDRRYPIDSQNCAQAIQTRCILVAAGLDDLVSVADMVEKIDTELYLRTGGYYCYQKRSFYRNKIFYLRWSQAPMLRALTYFLKVLHD